MPGFSKACRVDAASCQSFIEILQEAGLPKAGAQIVLPSDINLAAQMVSDSIAFLFHRLSQRRLDT